MADEPSVTPSNEIQTPEPMGNDPAARNPDGTLKDSLATPETKSEPKAEAEPKVEDKKTEGGAPETYADFTAPEGYVIDEAALAKATPLFKELGLSQDQAQKLVDFYGEASREAAEEPFKQYESVRNGWRDEVIKDSTLGNGKDGLKPEVQARITKAIDSLPTDVASAFREAMTITGAGDNPAFIRAFNLLAEQVTEGSLVSGRGPSPHGQSASGQGRPTPAQALYPNLPTANR